MRRQQGFGEWEADEKQTRQCREVRYCTIAMQHPQKSKETVAAGTSGSEGKRRRLERVGETPGFAGLYHSPSPLPLPPSCHHCPLPPKQDTVRRLELVCGASKWRVLELGTSGTTEDVLWQL